LRIHHKVWKSYFEPLLKSSADARASLQWRRLTIFQQYSAVSFVGKLSVAAILGVLFVCVTPGLNVGSAHAQAQTHTISAISAGSARSPVGTGNYFPYGQCTWWANQRYFQLHRVFVPWRTQSNAWQWTARAYQFGWHVSRSPTVGSIIDLQPWVQGAYGLGHVAVVERVLRNGHVIASNMSWGASPWRVTYVQFAPGPGVTFIHR
jgi:surface antigen